MNKYFFLILSLLISASLAGCGAGSGGDSNSDSVNNNGGNGNITYVSGEFKTANDSRHYYPDDSSLSGNLAEECIYQYNYNYFESANTLIYGDPTLPDTDFKYAATLIENNLDKAFDLMGLDRSEFNNFRPRYSSIVARNMISFLDGYEDLEGKNQDITSIDSDFVAPDGWAEMQSYARISFIKGYWNDISDEKQDQLIAIYNQRYSFDVTNGYLIPDKIVVCLDTTRDKVLYGQSTLLGMNLAPNSRASRSDAEQVILHELIHTIQLNVSTPVDAGGVNDIWFMEGQASFLAGQKVAASADGFYPVDVVHFADADTVFQDNLGVAYEHYAKAYSYIDANSGKEAALRLLINVRHYQGGGTNDTYYGVSSDRFSAAFGANMLKKDGNPLTIEDYRNNYHSIVE
mgnify:CR=1 FL=1